MDESEIRAKALARLSEIFRVPVSDLHPAARFGVDLKASFVSDFKRNELTIVDDDIHDVADKHVSRKLANGSLTIFTVLDYCDHLVACYKSKPSGVIRIREMHSTGG